MELRGARKYICVRLSNSFYRFHLDLVLRKNGGQFLKQSLSREIPVIRVDDSRIELKLS